MNTYLITRWKTLLALVFMYLAIVLNSYLLWAVFFIYWSLSALITQEAYLIEPVNKHQEPVLYWVITLSWLLLSLATLGYELWRIFS